MSKPLVMGILNTTPDSFYDGGEYNTLEKGIEQAKQMLNEGAAIIDIGGYSSRPGADDVPLEEELKRTIPLIESLLKEVPEAIISIDTFRAEVAKQAIEAGAAIVNDISAGDDDPNMIPLVAEMGVPYIAMHKKGSPKTMQANPSYVSVVNEVFDYLAAKVEQCRQAGIKDVIIDPGFGFGKTIEHNLELIRHLERFTLINAPVLVGISRKSMIRKILNIESTETLNGTTVLNTLAIDRGAHVLRVHDVKEAVEMVKLVSRMREV